MNQDFLAKNVNVEIYGDKKTRYKSKADLKWSLSIYFRDYGIQEINIHVPDQEIKVSSVVEVEVGDDTEDQDIEETFLIENVELELDSVSLRGAVLPQEISITLKNNKPVVEVKF